jgi:protein-tyrosine phosphatase
MTDPGRVERGPRGGASEASGVVGHFDLLFVCTGNICRSPTAELYAAHHLPREHFRVHSAGTAGLDGWPIEPFAAKRLAAQGIAYDAFRARRMTQAMVEGADLVLTATREHRGAVVTLVPRALPKTFTMREFARLLDGVEDTGLPDEPVARARALVAYAAGRRGQVWVPREEDDVADPYGYGDEAYERAEADIVAALRRPLHLLQS